MKLRLISSSVSCIFLGCVALCSCADGNSEEENASIVNVEKGVAPALAAPQMKSDREDEMQPVGIIGSEVALEPVKENPKEVAEETPEVKPEKNTDEE